VDFGIMGEPATLDPYAQTASDLTFALVRPLYRSLYRLLPDGRPEADLVAGMEETSSGVKVRLREAVWSNGRPITAGDVVRSARRAGPPSGLAGLDAIVLGEREVGLVGKDDDWEQRLARVSFVLPRGRIRRGVYSGPLRLARRTPGLQLVYKPNPRGEEVMLDRLRVWFVERTGTLLTLLENGELDAAAIPSTVNLAARLQERDIPFQKELGWEAVWLDLSSLEPRSRRAVAGKVDRQELQEGFVRGDGRITNTLRPGPGSGSASGLFEEPRAVGSPGSFSLAVPKGDELLDLAQRAIQLQLADADARLDLVTSDVRRFYGPWRREAPVDAFLLRSSGAPGMSDGAGRIRTYRAVPLFHVATYLAGDLVAGFEVNPTLDGPLWNMPGWSRAKGR
jgi:ABC-type transport system substrate-binding protein